MNKSFSIQSDDILENYVLQTLQPEDEILRNARRNSIEAGLPEIQVHSLDARLLEVLVRLNKAQNIVEIGALGGYSGITLLRGSGPQGFLHTCEISKVNAELVTSNLEMAGFAGRFHVHVGPALKTLQSIQDKGPFDLVFIDADKENYPNYLSWAAQNLKVGGVVIGDNTFAWGSLAPRDGQVDAPSTIALRHFHEALTSDSRFRTTIIPTGEGLTVAVKIR